MESHRHAQGEELGVLWHCQHLDLPSPQWRVMALDIIMSQQGWIQNAGEKSSDPTHTGHAETTGKMFHFHWVCAGISVLWWMCWCFLVALLRPEAAQLCPFASTSQGATYGSTETFLKLRLQRCLSPACPCLNAFVPTMCLSHYWNGKPELNESSAFQFTFHWKLGCFSFLTYLFSFLSSPSLNLFSLFQLKKWSTFYQILISHNPR